MSGSQAQVPDGAGEILLGFPYLAITLWHEKPVYGNQITMLLRAFLCRQHEAAMIVQLGWLTGGRSLRLLCGKFSSARHEFHSVVSLAV